MNAFQQLVEKLDPSGSIVCIFQNCQKQEVFARAYRGEAVLNKALLC